MVVLSEPTLNTAC